MSFALESRMEMSRQLAVSPDIGSLQKSSANSPEALGAVAKEFESLFMNMMMKSMRSANRTLSEGNYFNSFESKMYEDMLDEKLSVSLSENGGLGIADLLMRQFAPAARTPSYDLESIEPGSTSEGASVLSSDLSLNNKVFPADRRAAFDDPVRFVEEMLPKAEQAARALETKPEFIVAQAALETGWGKHVMFNGEGMNSHNLFGIKANSDWQGPTVSIESLEINHGVAEQVKSPFKVYPDYETAFRDYAALIGNNERYQDVTGSQDIEAFTQGLAQGGYATDPQYGQKIAGVLDHLKGSQFAMRDD
ncbi:MAG: flagellar protein FlgJ [Candidatus Azotimanducaceae bacterium]|jgi:flagellar protein FlgJ